MVNITTVYKIYKLSNINVDATLWNIYIYIIIYIYIDYEIIDILWYLQCQRDQYLFDEAGNFVGPRVTWYPAMLLLASTSSGFLIIIFQRNHRQFFSALNSPFFQTDPGFCFDGIEKQIWGRGQPEGCMIPMASQTSRSTRSTLSWNKDFVQGIKKCLGGWGLWPESRWTSMMDFGVVWEFGGKTFKIPCFIIIFHVKSRTFGEAYVGNTPHWQKRTRRSVGGLMWAAVLIGWAQMVPL